MIRLRRRTSKQAGTSVITGVSPGLVSRDTGFQPVQTIPESTVDVHRQPHFHSSSASRSPLSRPSIPVPADVTFLISTHNRRETLRNTLGHIHALDDATGCSTQTIVIDNASTDGTAALVAREFPRVLLIRDEINRGACAKNAGLPFAEGRFIVFLDDDSYPDAGSIRPMIKCFQADEKLGAAVFDVLLPDGSHECSAYPTVFIGCGTAFRREALVGAGGLPDDFFMQAEEYDLSLRLMDRGWSIRRFAHLRVRHLKTPGSRIPTRTMRLDTRNNLLVITRYFPRRWVIPFAIDWMRRYYWIASAGGRPYQRAFLRGLADGVWRSLRPGHRRPVSSDVFEQFAMVQRIQSRLESAVRCDRVRSVILVDVGKNILPFWLAAHSAGLTVLAVADPKLAKSRRRYRGAPVLDDAGARALAYDAALIANVSPVQSADRRRAWRRADSRPVIDLFEAVESVANPCL